MKKKAKGVVLYDDESVRHNETYVANDETFTLDELYALTECDCVEFIRLRDHCKGLVMVIDESGKLEGRPINTPATVIAQMFNGIQPNDFIVGTAVVTTMEMIQ